MEKARTLAQKIEGAVTSDGAGVKLRRVFGFSERNTFDPFLLLDHFGSDDPRDYLAGFPWHPHRGIETVTYLMAGNVAHGDSMGNSGTIGPGDAQWMTAGSGVIHQEMPEPGADGKTMEGFQLWANLPAELKMTEPRYRAVLAGEIPVIARNGCRISVLAGEYSGVAGATPDLFVPVLYLIAALDPGAELAIPVPASHGAAAYAFRGAAGFGGTRLEAGFLGRFPASAAASDDGEAQDFVVAKADADLGASFLFIAGRPLGEPIAWGGPIVMNTREELRRAFDEYDAGTFVKKRTGAAKA